MILQWSLVKDARPSRVGKKPGFFKKKTAQWVFLGFFGFFGVFLPGREGFQGFFQFHKYF
jgi:hypothetical protein